MRQFNFILLFTAFSLSIAGCGSGNSEATFEGAPAVSQDEAQAAADYEKQMQEDFKKNYGNN